MVLALPSSARAQAGALAANDPVLFYYGGVRERLERNQLQLRYLAAQSTLEGLRREHDDLRRRLREDAIRRGEPDAFLPQPELYRPPTTASLPLRRRAAGFLEYGTYYLGNAGNRNVMVANPVGFPNSNPYFPSDR